MTLTFNPTAVQTAAIQALTTRYNAQAKTSLTPIQYLLLVLTNLATQEVKEQTKTGKQALAAAIDGIPEDKRAAFITKCTTDAANVV